MFVFLGSSLCFSVDIARDIVARGSALVGSPYRYGGTNPSGFDCSGLVNYLYKPFLPDLPRSASAIAQYGSTVSLDSISPGDLVFYATGSNRSEITHVGIYIGQNTLIQSVSAGPSRGVILTDLDEKYWKERFKWVKRLFPRTGQVENRADGLSYSKGSYSGALQNLEPGGKGRMDLKNGDFYIGDFKDGLFHGKGEYHYSNGDIYVGSFFNGRESGGELIRSDGSRYSASRNESGTFVIDRRTDRSSARINYLLETPTEWDDWLANEQKLFRESLDADRNAADDELRRFEEWKKNSGN